MTKKEAKIPFNPLNFNSKSYFKFLNANFLFIVICKFLNANFLVILKFFEKKIDLIDSNLQ